MNPVSTFLFNSIQRILQILQVWSSFSSLLSSFDDSAKLLHCRKGNVLPSSSWVISSLKTVPDGIVFSLSLFPLFSSFLSLFSFLFLIETFALYGKLFSRVFSGEKLSSKFLDSIGNSYCKKDYSKGEVIAVEIAQTRLPKMKKNLVIASFHCVGSKIWKR